MNKNSKFKETMLILIVSYINESKDYLLDIESLEIINRNTEERLDINQLIEDITVDKRYVEKVVDAAWYN